MYIVLDNTNDKDSKALKSVKENDACKLDDFLITFMARSGVELEIIFITDPCTPKLCLKERQF